MPVLDAVVAAVLALALAAVLALVLAGRPDDARPSAEPGPVVPGPTTLRPTVAGTGPLGLKWSWFQPDTFDFVRAAGGGWTFHEVEWCDVEPAPGMREWTALDTVVRTALDLGHQPLLKIRTGQCWGTVPTVAAPTDAPSDATEGAHKTPSMPPVDVDTYLAFVTDLVQRYAGLGVHDWAIENEVDVANHWAGDLAAYDALARQVAPAIRAADPEAHLLDSGLSSTAYGVALAASLQAAGDDVGALETYRSYYARRLAGSVSRWPAVTSSTDLATVLASPAAQRSLAALDLAVGLVADGVVDAYQLHFYEPSSSLPAVLDLVESRLAGAGAVEAWEVGVAWPGADWNETAQAAEVMRLVAVLLARDVRRIVYLPVAWTPTAQAQVFRGLALEDGQVLAAGRTWLALADALSGLRGTPTALTGDLTGVVWTAGDHQAAIVWAPGPPVTLPPSVGHVVSATGDPLGPGTPVGAQPVLVTGSAGEDLPLLLGRGR